MPKQFSSDYLVVGLGNPGKKYEKTRHNVGFMAIERVADNLQAPIFRENSTFNSFLSEKRINEKKIIFVKPLTFMNLSGKSISKIANFYKIPFDRIIVIHDDVDIALGKIKIAKDKGSGGHKGVNSIIKEIANKKFVRIRIGILPNEKPEEVESFVLKKFEKDEEKPLIGALEKTIKAVDMIMNESFEKAASILNE